MSWFTKSADERSRKCLTEEIWVNCGRCRAYVFKEDWEKKQRVCSHCNYHGKLTAQERIDLTIDAGTFTEMFGSIRPGDPLLFVDAKGPYSKRVDEARAGTRLNESVVTGTG